LSLLLHDVDDDEEEEEEDGHDSRERCGRRASESSPFTLYLRRTAEEESARA